jgi:hypothetical protein
LGYRSGYTVQAANAIAIGVEAGSTGQGSGAIAIGFGAGKTSQNVNSIIINASGSVLNANVSGTFVNPIRSIATNANMLAYNTSTSEISYTSLMNTFTPTWSTPTLTAAFPTTLIATGSVTAFTVTISAYSFSSGVTNAQYFIILSASGGSITITPLTSAAQTVYYFNFSANITVNTNKYAIMTVIYDGTRYYISCNAFNSN